MSEDERKIREVISTWISATQAGDLKTVLSLMDEDVVFLRAGCPPMRGRKAFGEESKGMEGARFEGKSNVQEIRIFGELACCWQHLSITMTPPNGAEMKLAGDILGIFRKEPNGKWVLFRDANMLSPVS